MNLVENYQDLMIMYSHTLMKFMDSRQKLELGDVGLKNTHFRYLVYVTI